MACAQGSGWDLGRCLLAITRCRRFHCPSYRFFEYVRGSVFVSKKESDSVKQWSSTWWSRIHQLKAEVLLDVKCNAIGVALNKSSILRLYPSQGVFATWLECKRSIVGYCCYYGFFVEKYVSSVIFRFETYGHSMLKVSRETFLKSTNCFRRRLRPVILYIMLYS